MKSWFVPGRATEASGAQLATTGAAGGYGADPIDGDRNYQSMGSGRNELPTWTLDRARKYAINAYRSNPMAKAVVDTYTAFCVGDSGVSLQCSNSQVRAVAEQFWNDPRVNLGGIQELMFRDHMQMGETVVEQLVGATTGVVRISIIDPQRVTGVELLNGNPLWPSKLLLAGDVAPLDIVTIDDLTDLRTGQASFFASNKALLTDRRGVPFLATIVDDLESYAVVLSNLVDRTALARYMVWDVTVEGDQDDVDAFVAARGGMHVPPSGTVEVHNQSVAWKPQTVQTGAFEDIAMLGGVLTNVAAGTGLAKTWLADPDGANRATSMSMAEPVRRRLGSVQNVWLGYQTELVRFAVDRAVAARRIPAMVESTDSTSGERLMVPASQTVRVTGPAIAASDTQVMATMLMNLGTAIKNLVDAGVLTKAAAALAVEKGWEQFTGQPFRSDLRISDTDNVDDVAQQVDEATTRGIRRVS